MGFGNMNCSNRRSHRSFARHLYRANVGPFLNSEKLTNCVETLGHLSIHFVAGR
jgi:hypothetical protein